VLADEAGQSFFELLKFAFMNQQPGKFAAELGGNAIERIAQRLMPMLWIRCFE